MSGAIDRPVCHEHDFCFAQIPMRNKDDIRCSLLRDGYKKSQKCPFCKPNALITNGQTYPIREPE